MKCRVWQPRRVGRVIAIAMAVGGCSILAYAQAPLDPNHARRPLFKSYQEFKDSLSAIAALPDAAKRLEQLDAFWNRLQAAGHIPYAQSEQVAFLHRGDGESVNWVGDFNSWNPNSAGWHGVRLDGTDLWMLEKTFAEDARVDYKIVVNGGEWLLDPANSLQAWSGFGPNSELRMPGYEYPQEAVRRNETPRGRVSENINLTSANLGYAVQYRVYTPAAYDEKSLQDLPVVYVTDGHEYAADHMGGMVIILDNLIAAGSIPPIMAVFIDPRDPTTSVNRRQAQYTQNAKFAAFVADELLPAVDAAYRTCQSPHGRAIVGTSLGGLNAAYFGATRPDAFGKIGVQSPAPFQQFAPDTLKLLASQPLANKLKFYVAAGTIGDGQGGVELAKVLKENRYDFTFEEVNEGHSWGNWRGTLPKLLVTLFAPDPTTESVPRSAGP